MTRWRATVNIKDLIDPSKDFREVAQQLAVKLDSRKRLFDRGMDDFADELRDIAQCDDASVEDVDEVLQRLYDYADSERIWLGP